MLRGRQTALRGCGRRGWWTPVWRIGGAPSEAAAPGHAPRGARRDSSSFAGMSRIKFNGFGASPSQRRCAGFRLHGTHPGAARSVAPLPPRWRITGEGAVGMRPGRPGAPSRRVPQRACPRHRSGRSARGASWRGSATGPGGRWRKEGACQGCCSGAAAAVKADGASVGRAWRRASPRHKGLPPQEREYARHRMAGSGQAWQRPQCGRVGRHRTACAEPGGRARRSLR